ncbi:rod shape-determining protein MreC [Pediococcus acidilactici]|uniref:rod shape-determining protein MreC n=1 Tax=Pediococcus acidilactici TaxID=1254 RepID=UPI000326E707|nr:rod shape-determining protein MreC [Pediococcus acidilactici]EOA08873.1 rod shape-determining protein MreC, mreC [Pediococcus acidilactici D3]MBW4797137.1 rod shape-determining protein MreC [Pediococcus acidilactici]MBW9306903.1 rod shape-determining protein MreC [Pediococcus acidilactici]MCE5962256.1 rod shape-determining protein MreC [Pediococcus acidilactici]MCW8083374.1 rod shape-determining protein MreC [Pediococcus acidilactici]
MHKFFSNRKLVLTVICAIIAAGLITGSLALGKKDKTPAVQKLGNDLFGAVSRVIAIPAHGMQTLSTNLNNFVATYEENERLRQDIDKLSATHAENKSLKEENRELKQIVGLKNSMTDYSLTPAIVLTRSPSSWQDLVTVNKGTANGVKKNQPVLAGNGLVGRVVEANYSTSKVELISDNNESANRFAIQVQAKDGNYVNGIITGYDKKTNEIIMGQVTEDKDVAVGSQVITSGLGGVTPKGLYVGKVAKVSKEDYGLANEIRIKPAAKLSNVNDVYIAKLD